MKLLCTATSLSFVLLILCTAATFAQNTTLTANFEQRSLVAATADGKPIQHNNAFEPTFVAGVAGGAALELNGENLSYPVNKSYFNINNGALAFWIRPESWGNGLKSADKAQVAFVPIFAVSREGGDQWTLLFFATIDSNTGRTQLSFQSMLPGKGRNIYLQETAGVDCIRRDQWSMVILTWTNMELNAYVNGTRIGSASYGLPCDKKFDPQWGLWFMPKKFWSHDYRYKTAIAGMRLYDAAMTTSQVNVLYETAAMTMSGEKMLKAEAPVPLTANVPAIDGELKAGEWDDATKMPLMTMGGSAVINSNFPAWVLLKHDRDNFYVACHAFTRHIVTPAAANQADEKISGGTEFALCWRHPKASEKQYYQVRVAPNGAYMSRNAEGEWNSVQFRQKARVDRDGWTVEIAIPLAEIGVKSSENCDFQFALHRPEINDRQDSWAVWNLEVPRQLFSAKMGMLHFRDDAATFRIENLGDLNYGVYNIKLGALPFRMIRYEANISGKKQILSSSGEILVKTVSLDGAIDGQAANNLIVLGHEIASGKRVFCYNSRFCVRDPLRVETVCYPSLNELRVKVDVRGMQESLQDALNTGKVNCRVRIDSCKDGANHGIVSRVLRSFEEHVTLKFQNLTEGDYVITTTVSAEGKDTERQIKFTRPSDVFLQDRKGLERMAPKPWTPIKQSGDTVVTAFHKYVFGKGAFPTKAWSQGQLVLSSGPRLFVKTGNRELEFVAKTERHVASDDDKLIDVGIMECREAGAAMDWKRAICYDGMIRYDLKLRSVKKPVKIESLRLVMSVPMTASTYAHTPNYNHDWTRNGRVDAFPIAWLTNEQTGFCLFTDNDANWVYPEAQPPIRLRKTGDVATIEAAMIQSAVALNRSASYVIGLMATPGKPPRPDWRKIHCEGWGAIKGQTLQTIGWLGMEHPVFRRTLYYTDPQPANFQYWENRLKSQPAKVAKLVPYGFLNAMPDNNPVYDFYGAEWSKTIKGAPAPRFDYSRDEIDGKWFYLGSPVCVNKIGYADYTAYYVDKYLCDFPCVAGTYQDGGGVGETDTPYKDTNLKDVFRNSRVPYNSNLFGLRDLYERLYKITRKHRGDEGYVWSHDWDRYCAPIVSFVDIVFPGEEFMHTIRKGLQVYVEDTPLEQWQSNYNSEIFGASVQFLSQYRFYGGDLIRLSPEKRDEYTRPLLMMCLIHDVPLSGAGYPALDKPWAILDGHNVGAAEFHGYWRQARIASNNEKVKVSYYNWRGLPKLLVMVGNLENRNNDVLLNVLDFNPSEIQAKDEMSGKSVDLSKPLPLDPYGFRIFQFKHSRFQAK